MLRLLIALAAGIARGDEATPVPASKTLPQNGSLLGQPALATRAGTDAVAHAVRLLLEADPNRVLVSLDGVGAFDHIRRAQFLQRLHDVPSHVVGVEGHREVVAIL